MSSLLTFIDCPDVQDQLDDYFCMGKTEDAPLSRFLFGQSNNANVLNRVVSPGAGKLRTVVLTYFRRLLEAEVSDGITRDCPTGPKRGHTSASYELDPTDGVQVTRSFNIIDLIAMCQSNENYRSILLKDLLDGVRRKMETQLATQLVAFVGGYSIKDKNPDGTAIAANVKSVKTLVTAANPTQFYNAHEAILQTARLNAYCSAPIIAGEYEIANYYRRNTLAGCCADIGIDLRQFISGTQPILLQSYRISDAFGSVNNFLSMSAGAAIPIWFNLHDQASLAQANDDMFFAGLITDPITNITFDLLVRRDCYDWIFTISLPFQLKAAPDDMFENSDPLDGNRMIHKYVVANS